MGAFVLVGINRKYGRRNVIVCSRCNKEVQIKHVSWKRNGIVERSIGVPNWDAICLDCTTKMPIDETTMKDPINREPGSDDDVGEHPF